MLDNEPMAPKPTVLNDNGDSVEVDVPGRGRTFLSRSNPMHRQMLDTYGIPSAPPALAPMEEVQPTPVAPTPQMAPAQPMQPPMAMDMTRKTETQTERKSVPMAVQKKLEEASIHRAQAIQLAEKASVNQMQAQNLVEENNIKQLEAQNQLIQARELQRTQQANQMRQDLINKSEEMSNMKVDPDFFGRMDTGSKLMSGLAIALGGLGQAYQGENGKENMGLKMVLRAADADIDAQKANINIKKEGLQAKRGAFQDFLSITQDERAAELAEKARILDIYKAQLQRVVTSNANDIIKANAQKELAGVEMEAAKMGAELNQTVEKRATTSVNEVKTAKPTGPVKPLEMAPKDVQDRIYNYESGLREMDRLVTIGTRNKGKLGWPGRFVELKGELGMQNASEAELESSILQATADKTHAISGAGTTEKEVSRLGKILGRLKDNPDAFFAKLAREKDRLESELVNTRKMYEGIATLPNPTYKTSIEQDKVKSSVGFKK
jgi:hypothetical protein